MINDVILKYLKEHLDDDGGGNKSDSNYVVIKQSGTFFFLYIDPRCELLESCGNDPDDAVVQIEFGVLKRFIKAFLENCNNEMPSSLISELVDMVVRIEPNEKYDNGEIYLWLHNLRLSREFAVKVLLSVVELLENDPIEISLGKGSNIEVNFFGWGFGYI